MKIGVTLNKAELARVQRALDKLGKVETLKPIQEGVYQGARVYVDTGRSLLKARLLGKHSRRATHLVDSFRARTKRNKLGGMAGFDSKTGAHAHLVDRGTTARWTKDGRYTGIMPANLFWSDTFTRATPAVRAIMIQSIEKAVKDIQ